MRAFENLAIQQMHDDVYVYSLYMPAETIHCSIEIVNATDFRFVNNAYMLQMIQNIHNL